jgi:molybdate transport system substrate-binding protein
MLGHALLLLLALALAGCSQAAAPPTLAPAAGSSGAPTVAGAATTSAANATAAPAAVPAPGGEHLTVYAASSLTDAFKALGALFTQKTGQSVDFNFGASNTLRTQSEQGGKADSFASANAKEMDTLTKAGLVAGDASIFATNRLVVVLPKDNPAGIQTLQDLGKSGVKFVTAQPGVPVGQYAQDALTKMSQDATFGMDFKQKVDANTVSKEDNVRAVLSKVTLGEADAAIVYVTDIGAAKDKVATLAIPDQFNTVAQYPIAVLKDAPHADQARQFVDLVLSPEGQDVLTRFGFAAARG